MTPTFDIAFQEFFDSNLPNAWIAILDPDTGKAVGEVYVRKAVAVFKQEPGRRYKTLDIANIQIDADKVGQGYFTRWIERVQLAARHVDFIEAIHIELVQEPRFQQFIQTKMGPGWQLARDPYADEQERSFWKETGNAPDTHYAKAVCKIGQGADCCRYITMGASGWSCAKHEPSIARVVDQRAALGQMNARSDNCDGFPVS